MNLEWLGSRSCSRLHALIHRLDSLQTVISLNNVYVCVLVCVCACTRVRVRVHVYACSHVPCCMCGNQRTTSGIGFSPCLRQVVSRCCSPWWISGMLLFLPPTLPQFWVFEFKFSSLYAKHLTTKLSLWSIFFHFKNPSTNVQNYNLPFSFKIKISLGC